MQLINEVKSSMEEYADLIYGFFLGNKQGEILKERMFNPHYCQEDILSNIVKSICSFAEETKVSDQGMIELSTSNVSFVKIQDITYVLIHGLTEKKQADLLINSISQVFETKSKAKFHSGNTEQVFSGASAVFSATVEELFSDVIKIQNNKIAQAKSDVSTIEEEILGFELIAVPLQYNDINLITMGTTEEKNEEERPSTSDASSIEEKLSAITFNILNSINGIEHLVFVSHNEKTTELFFQNGKLTEMLVEKTLKICEKFLHEIIEMMNDEDSENAIEASRKHQIIFVPLDEKNFMYAIATKVVDPILLQPVFERIANRIKKVVLDYKKKK